MIELWKLYHRFVNYLPTSCPQIFTSYILEHWNNKNTFQIKFNQFFSYYFKRCKWSRIIFILFWLESPHVYSSPILTPTCPRAAQDVFHSVLLNVGSRKQYIMHKDSLEKDPFMNRGRLMRLLSVWGKQWHADSQTDTCDACSLC